MKTLWKVLLGGAVVLAVGTAVYRGVRNDPVAQNSPNAPSRLGPAQSGFAGKVVDASGKPVAGAAVEFWPYGLASQAQWKTVTDSQGAYELNVPVLGGQLLIRKAGLAPVWKQNNQAVALRQQEDEPIMLAPPSALAGVVVDEADKPVANVPVCVATAFLDTSLRTAGQTFQFLSGAAARDCFATRTDATGHFRIQGFPTNASAEFVVQAPGKAVRSSGRQAGPFNSGSYRAGEDIRLVVEPAGTIEGRIVVEGAKQPLPFALLVLQPDGPRFSGMTEREPTRAAADGGFVIRDVPAGSYRIQAGFGNVAAPEWVAATVPVTVDAGKTTRDVEVKASRGGLLEVIVRGKGKSQPPAGMRVNAFSATFQANLACDRNGIARLRLPPGEYQVSAFREMGSSEQSSARVEAGKTNRLELEMEGPQRINGVVRQPDGKPAANVHVQLVSSFGPGTTDFKTDDQGKFQFDWNRQRFGQNESTPCVLARDVEHNLAVAEEVEQGAGTLELKLVPALTLTGRAESDGKPLANVAATLIFWTGRNGTHLAGLSRRTSTPGQFEIPALPPGRKYGILVTAPGYGQHAMYDIGASAEGGRMELDPAELKVANRKVSGQVLNADDKPVARTYVNVQGEGQPFANTQSDSHGRFAFDQVCEGPMQISASSGTSFGNVTAEGGDTNVVLRLGQNLGAAPGVKPHKLKGTVLDPAGKPVAGAQVAVFPGEASNWTRTGTNGAFSLTWSLQPWQRQAGGALLVGRDLPHELAATQDLREETAEMNLELKPAVTIAGRVATPEGEPLPGAEVGLLLKTGNTYQQLGEKVVLANSKGEYELKCLPADAQYLVFASAKGRGRAQQNVFLDPETNRCELVDIRLALADQLLAGQVVDENEKPVSGVNVMLNGDGQPQGHTVTDSKGRFHFQVCDGPVQLFANSQNGWFGQATADGGDTNVVVTIGSQPGMMRRTPRRSLVGQPLPDLATLNLPPDSLPAGKPVLLCLFDLARRPSRRLVPGLASEAGALRQKGVTVIGAQVAPMDDQAFETWTNKHPLPFPVGRVTQRSEKSKWTSQVADLPCLILCDPEHRVLAAGFSFDELEDKIAELK